MTYSDRQIARDASYSRTYEAWVASLPPEERAQLAAQNLARPDASRRTSTRLGDPDVLDRAAAGEPSPRDNAENTGEASPEPTEAPTAPQAAAPRGQTSQTAADLLAAFCARIRAHPNPLLALDALCYSTGLMGIEGLSQTELAKRHGVTRAAFSKLAVQMTDLFDLAPARGMRSRRVRRTCRQARLTHLATKANGDQSKAA